MLAVEFCIYSWNGFSGFFQGQLICGEVSIFAFWTTVASCWSSSCHGKGEAKSTGSLITLLWPELAVGKVWRRCRLLLTFFLFLCRHYLYTAHWWIDKAHKDWSSILGIARWDWEIGLILGEDMRDLNLRTGMRYDIPLVVCSICGFVRDLSFLICFNCCCVRILSVVDFLFWILFFLGVYTWQETTSGEPSNPPLRRSELSSCDWSMVRGVSRHDKDWTTFEGVHSLLYSRVMLASSCATKSDCGMLCRSIKQSTN